MLRMVQVGNALPTQYPADINASFQPGQIAQLGVTGNDLVCGVSDGSAPLGVIDDIKTTSFTAPAIDEVVIASAMGVADGYGNYVTPVSVMATLNNAYIISSSFATSVQVELKPTNGVVIFPAGTALNFDLAGTGTPDSIRAVVSYSYQIAGIPGDDSTQGSGKVTVWFQRMIFQTDQYETNQRYPINAPLFVSEAGVLTTRQPHPDYPGVAMVTGPPTSVFGTLEALWL